MIRGSGLELLVDRGQFHGIAEYGHGAVDVLHEIGRAHV
jgi:hypothetical protein